MSLHFGHHKILRLIVTFIALMLIAARSATAATIQNPLLRPPTLSSEPVSLGQNSPQAQSDNYVKGRVGDNAREPEDLRAKAAARLTQEDLNVRQQALNASIVPVPLQQLFSRMYVAAHARGAIVLRRSLSITQVSPAQEALVGASNSGTSAIRATAQLTQSGPIVLRFQENAVTNVMGYRLRAHLDGLDVSVDWQDARGRWVNVFFGALESAPGGSSTPDKASLQKPDKEAFQYLVPKLSSQNNQIGGSPYGNQSPYGSNYPQSGGANGYPTSGSNINNFGTAAPIFR